MSSLLGKRRSQTTNAPPKKTKSNEHPLPLNAFQLRISTLRFVGHPRLVRGGDNPDVVGSWDIPSGSPPYINLQPNGYSKSEEAFIYSPIRPFSFIYKRSTRVIWDHEQLEDGALAFDHEEQSPRLYLHPANSHERPYNGSIFDMDKADESEAPRIQKNNPPFQITTCDFDSNVVSASRASRYRTVSIEEPDVEGANNARGGMIFYGWFGDWVKEFIKADCKNWGKQTFSDSALGCMKYTQWDNRKTKLWGIQVKLEPVPNSVVAERNLNAPDEDHDSDWEEDDEKGQPKYRLRAYKIRATILRVYVKEEFFNEPEEPKEWRG